MAAAGDRAKWTHALDWSWELSPLGGRSSHAAVSRASIVRRPRVVAVSAGAEGDGRGASSGYMA